MAANHPTDECFIALSKATSFPPVSRDMLYFGWLENEMSGTPTSPGLNWKVIPIKVSSSKLFNWFPDFAFWRSASTPPRPATEGEVEGHHHSRGSESGPAPRMQLWNHCFPQLGIVSASKPFWWWIWPCEGSVLKLLMWPTHSWCKSVTDDSNGLSLQ